MVTAPTSSHREPSPARAKLKTEGYAKGDAARQRVLDAALLAFGQAGFKGATTRQIAEQAGVQLPAIAYYFGNKDGLYLACAHEVIARYRARVGQAAEHALALLQPPRPADTPSPRSAQQAYDALSQLIHALVGLLVGSCESQRWTAFIAREMGSPGPAYELLYRDLWAPGVDLVTRLIARVQGPADDTPAALAQARVQAVLLISSLVRFQSGRELALQLLQWPRIGPDECATIAAVLLAPLQPAQR